MANHKSSQGKKNLFAFLIITFVATSSLSIAIYLILGPISFPPSKLWFSSFQIYMLIPTTVAIICTVYFEYKSITNRTKLIFIFFLIYVVLFTLESYVHPIIGTVRIPIVALHPTDMEIPLISMAIAIIGIVTIIIMNLKKKWKKDLESAQLSFGRNIRYYLILPLLLSIMFIISFILNYIIGLGVPTKQFNLMIFISTLIQSLFLSFFVLWPIYFGEEFGWRVYLQDRLFRLLGNYKGVFILGVIWGLWHTPLILIGLIYPGQPVLGIILMIVSTILLGIILSYAVLKTGSVWIAVILHLIVDTIIPVAQYFIATSINPIFSFGTGIYGFGLLAIFSILLLKSTVWRINSRFSYH